MNCREVQCLLSAYMDGALDGAAAREVQEHLDQCEPCRHDLESLAKTVKMIRALGQVQWDSPKEPPARVQRHKRER